MSSLFGKLLGESFDALPAAIKAFHAGPATRDFRGRCQVRRGTRWLSRACAAVMRLPAAGHDVPIRVRIEERSGAEAWSREFDGRILRSTLRQRGALLEERMGPMAFAFTLSAGPGTIEWRLAQVRCLGLPLPAAWFERVAARESVDAGRYRFDVRAEMSLVGLLVHYTGTLDAGG